MPSVGARHGTMFGETASSFRLLAGESQLLAEEKRGVSSASDQGSTPPSPFDADLSRTFQALGGVAARRRLHALHPVRPGDEGAMTGFAFTLLGGLAGSLPDCPVAPSRPILWIQDRTARAESGRPYGLGFAEFGFDHAQLVFVSTKGALDALAAIEMGLEIGGLAGVLAELPPSLPADMLTLGKRLALRAERSATPCFLLHASARSVPAPVATRWQIASLPAVPDGAWGASVPVAELTLIKNRFGPTGRWSVPLVGASSLCAFQGVSDVRVASLSPSLSQSVDANASDRSRSASARHQAA